MRELLLLSTQERQGMTQKIVNQSLLDRLFPKKSLAGRGRIKAKLDMACMLETPLRISVLSVSVALRDLFVTI